MSQQLELEIRSWLNEYVDSSRAADEVIKLWIGGKLSFSDQKIAASFLLNAGYHASLLQQLIRNLKAGEKIPWAIFAEVMGRSKIEIAKTDIDRMFLGSSEQEALEALVQSRALDQLDPRFANIREKLSKTLNIDVPKPTHRPSPLESLRRKLSQISPETKKEMDRIVKLFEKKAKKNPETAYDIAVGLHLMGLTEGALKILDLAPIDKQNPWTRMEFLIEAGRFVDVLELTNQIEEKMSQNPDSTLATAYYRALALGALGRKKEATEVLEQIVQADPDYRSAHTLLLEWSEK